MNVRLMKCLCHLLEVRVVLEMGISWNGKLSIALFGEGSEATVNQNLTTIWEVAHDTCHDSDCNVIHGTGTQAFLL
jgi:hypothetical protein